MTVDKTAITPSTAPSVNPLSAEELLAHSAYSSNDWTAKIPPTSSGFATLNNSSQRPGGPIKIHYELHGHGPIHIVFIMGLGAYRTAWKRQSKFFGHDRAEQYTCLVFDNRGIGLSDKPLSRYSTKEMAADVVELLGHVGWLDQSLVTSIISNLYTSAKPTTQVTRSINVIGVSMGGMISQELALLIPSSIQTLFLVSTASRVVRTVPFIENLRQRINMFIPKDIDIQLEEISHRLFSKQFLERPDTDESDPTMNFPTVRDRFAASELAKRQDKEGFTRKGFILQAIAAGWHSKDAAQLQTLVSLVGGNRIVIMHGTGDQMLTMKHFEIMREEIGDSSDVTYLTYPGAGHVLSWECEDEFNQAIIDNIARTKTIVA